MEELPIEIKNLPKLATAEAIRGSSVQEKIGRAQRIALMMMIINPPIA